MNRMSSRANARLPKSWQSQPSVSFASNERFFAPLRMTLPFFMPMTGQELLASLGKLFGPKIQEKTEFRGETTYTILPGDLREVAKFCRDDLSFDYLIDITSIDNFGEEPRFEIVYELYSMTLAVHLRLKLRVSEEDRRGRYRFRHLADGELARARDLRHDGNQIQRPSRSAPHPDVGRLPVLSAAKRISARRTCPAKCPMSPSPKPAPLEGGPFVTKPSTATAKDREPRAHPPEVRRFR